MVNYTLFRAILSVFVLLIASFGVNALETCVYQNGNSHIVDTPTDGRIIENIPRQFNTRYLKWKADLLSTDFGKSLWNKYENKKDFVLTIIVSEKNNRGAGTSDYKWNEEGQLVGATISLGGNLDRGFPDPSYYPVMNSLADFTAKREISSETVAASKFAHEFGHVNLTLISNADEIERQNRLMPIYNSIFLSNGYDLADHRLIELATEMGGTPNQIWENREYWGETVAMEFLLEKVRDRPIFCKFVSKVRSNMQFIGKEYESRFLGVAEPASLSVCPK